MCPSAHSKHQMKHQECVLFVPPAYLLKVSIARRAGFAEYSSASFRHFMRVVVGGIEQAGSSLLSRGFVSVSSIRVLDYCPLPLPGSRALKGISVRIAKGWVTM